MHQNKNLGAEKTSPRSHSSVHLRTMIKFGICVPFLIMTEAAYDLTDRMEQKD